MKCPYFLPGKCNHCTAFKGLFVPSIYEEKTFCTGDFHGCGIFQKYQSSSSKVSKEIYTTEIEPTQYEGVAI